MNFKLKLYIKQKTLSLSTTSVQLVLIFYVGRVYGGYVFLVYVDRSLNLTLKNVHWYGKDASSSLLWIICYGLMTVLTQ